MSAGYQIRRKARRKAQTAERWRQTGRNLAMLHGNINAVGVRFESFALMGFWARLRWLVTGRFDATKYLREAAAQEHAVEQAGQQTHMQRAAA